MLKKDIKLLSEYTGKPCATVILPVDMGFTADKLNHIGLKKALDQAKELVMGRYGNEQAGALIDSLEDLKEHYTISQKAKGLAVFVCNDFLKTIELPFTPELYVDTNDQFEIRELLYDLERMEHYFVMVLDIHTVRLFMGIDNTLEEIHDEHFPKHYIEEFEFNYPNPNNRLAMKTRGEEKSRIIENRVRGFYRSADKDFTHYLGNNKYPVFLLGSEKPVAYFMGESKNEDRISEKVHGNYSKATVAELDLALRSYLKKYHSQKQEEILGQIEESINKNVFTSSLEPVWEAVAAGNCRTLLVEKDFKINGSVSSDYSQVSVGDNSLEIEENDAVDSLIRQAMKKQAEVVFVDNGALAVYDHIGLIKRY